MLAPATEAEFGEERLLDLNLRSLAMYPDFVDALERATGRDVGFHRSGTLMVARDRDDLALFDEVFDFQKRLGLEVQRLSSRAARDLEPLLSPRVRGAIDVPGDHHVDPAALLLASRDAGAELGVVSVAARASTVTRAGDRISGVQLDSGERISADTVVVAAGCWSGTVRGVDPAPAVRPVKGQLLQLRASSSEELPTRTIRGIDAYIVTRRDGRVVIGATVEEKAFDRTPTAGAAHELLQAAFELVPGLLELEFVGMKTGLRPGSRSNVPTIGRAAPGLFVATGHFRNGVLLAPVTAEAIAEMVVADEHPDWIGPFVPTASAVAQ
jgi:glycine oxidase